MDLSFQKGFHSKLGFSIILTAAMKTQRFANIWKTDFAPFFHPYYKDKMKVCYCYYVLFSVLLYFFDYSWETHFSALQLKMIFI